MQANLAGAGPERIVLAVEVDSAAAQVQAFARARWVPGSAAEIAQVNGAYRQVLVTDRVVTPLGAEDLVETPHVSAAVAGTAASVGAVEQVSVVDAAEVAVDAAAVGVADKRISRWK